MMNKISLLIFLLAAVSFARAQQLYVGTYNIRYENASDSLKGNGWARRCPVIGAMVNFEQPDVLGTQEVLVHQLHDLVQTLDGYDYIGVGRDDGKEAGEFAAIFYKKDKLKVLDSGHFWLNETPDRPALGWDAACVRICTWAHLEDRSTHLRFYFFNLHLDHVGVVARRESAQLVMSRIRSMVKAAPVVLTGDFNVDQHDEVYNLFAQSGILKDTYTSARIRLSENGTFNAFDWTTKTDSRIDHVFVSPSFSVDRYGMLTNGYWTNDAPATPGADNRPAPQQPKSNRPIHRLPSDHYPVFVRLAYHP